MHAPDDDAPLAVRQPPHGESAQAFDEAAAPPLRTPSSAGLRGSRRPSRPRIHTAVTAGFVAHMTPPPTPASPSPGGVDVASPHHALFHNYLRALHAFDPATSALPDEDSSLATAAIKPGDLILVHCVHANGWADGTVLNTAVRGWLPTNYCEAYDHPHLRNLLNAMTRFWDLLGAGEDASLSTFVRQDYIRGLIAGVRYLLERADCLHRESPPVKQHAGVRRMRKGLLADLSSLVQIAKKLQEAVCDTMAGQVVPVLLDDLVCKAFRVVTRAVGFTDVWSQETRADSPRPVRMWGSRGEFDPGVSASRDPAQHFPDRAPVHAVAPPSAEDGHRSGGGKAPRSPSMAFASSDGLVTHRLSTLAKGTTHVGTGVLASEQLASVHDICISHIGTYIGHQYNARPASELIATTERLLTACRSMLAIIDQVCSHDIQASSSIEHIRTEFEVKIEQLAKSTQDVFRFSENPDDEIIMLPGQTGHLISVGMSMITNAGKCVMQTRQLIEKIGDFALDTSGIHTAASRGETPAPVDSMLQEPASTEETPADDRQPVDQEPTQPPPAPPSEEQLTLPALNSAPHSPAETTELVEEPNKESPPLLALLHPGSMKRASEASSSPGPVPSDSTCPARKDSFGISIAGSTDTFLSSTRDSSMTATSQASTRATTPEQSKESISPDSDPDRGRAVINKFASLSSIRSLVTEDSVDVEAQLLLKSYAHELTWNKDGQVTGGSLPALVEQLTTHDVAPDPQFVTAFFLTFRRFTEPREFAQALIQRFEYIGDSRTTGTPVRLRIYNVFKGWLETYWNAEADKDALGEIRFFALHKLKPVLPTAGDRLIELTRRITDGYCNGTISGPMVSGVGKISTSIGTPAVTDVPEPMVSGKQLNALRVAASGGSPCSITDLEPLEVARQITMLVAHAFCEIRPEELISMEWGKPGTQRANHVRKMCLLNTDLAHFVADSILAPESAKVRATVIKHWIKIGMACLELSNYDSVMSIMCSVNSSPVQRLKKTWDLVGKKSRARLDELDQVVDMSKNYTSLRRRLEAPTAPCVPFLGIYLTDLTFVIAGNPKRRQVPGSVTETGDELSVINFDMYTRTAKIISHVQKFQVPYRLKVVPEMRNWINFHLTRMRDEHADMVSHFHRRSLAVEPKDGERKQSIVPGGSLGEDRAKTSMMTSHHSSERLDFFFHRSFSMKPASSSTIATPDAAEAPKRAGAL